MIQEIKIEPHIMSIECQPSNYKITIDFGFNFVYYNPPNRKKKPVFKINTTPLTDESLISIKGLKMDEDNKGIILKFDDRPISESYMIRSLYKVQRKIIKKIVEINLNQGRISFEKSNIERIYVFFYKDILHHISFSPKSENEYFHSFEISLNQEGYVLKRFKPETRVDLVKDIFVREGFVECILENEVFQSSLEISPEMNQFLTDILMTEGVLDMPPYTI